MLDADVIGPRMPHSPKLTDIGGHLRQQQPAKLAGHMPEIRVLTLGGGHGIGHLRRFARHHLNAAVAVAAHRVVARAHNGKLIGQLGL